MLSRKKAVAIPDQLVLPAGLGFYGYFVRFPLGKFLEFCPALGRDPEARKGHRSRNVLLGKLAANGIPVAEKDQGAGSQHGGIGPVLPGGHLHEYNRALDVAIVKMFEITVLSVKEWTAEAFGGSPGQVDEVGSPGVQVQVFLAHLEGCRSHCRNRDEELLGTDVGKPHLGKNLQDVIRRGFRPLGAGRAILQAAEKFNVVHRILSVCPRSRPEMHQHQEKPGEQHQETRGHGEGEMRRGAW